MDQTIRPSPWQTLDTHGVCDNEYFRVREDRVVRPDGKEGRYYVVDFQTAGVGVVAMTETQEVYLVRQFRYTVGKHLWEIPAGSDAPGETVQQGAERELREEVGLEAKSWTYLGYWHTELSSTNGVFHCYLAEGLTQHEPEREGTEEIEVRTVPLVEALREVDDGEIVASSAIIALYKAWRHLENRRSSMQKSPR